MMQLSLGLNSQGSSVKLVGKMFIWVYLFKECLIDSIQCVRPVLSNGSSHLVTCEFFFQG